MREIEKLLLILWVSCTILSQVVPCCTVGWKETRSDSIASIDGVEFAYENTLRHTLEYLLWLDMMMQCR